MNKESKKLRAEIDKLKKIIQNEFNLQESAQPPPKVPHCPLGQTLSTRRKNKLLQIQTKSITETQTRMKLSPDEIDDDEDSYAKEEAHIIIRNSLVWNNWEETIVQWLV